MRNDQFCMMKIITAAALLEAKATVMEDECKGSVNTSQVQSKDRLLTTSY